MSQKELSFKNSNYSKKKSSKIHDSFLFTNNGMLCSDNWKTACDLVMFIPAVDILK